MEGWKEFLGSNSVAHVTLISNDEFSSVDHGDETKARIRSYNCVVVLVNLCGIVVFKSGSEQIVAIETEIAAGWYNYC